MLRAIAFPRRPGALLATLAAGVALSACATKAPPPQIDDRLLTSTADLHRISVSEVTELLEVPVAPNQTAFEPGARADMRSFLRLFRSNGQGALLIEAPQGSANEAAAANLAEHARVLAGAEGSAFEDVAVITYSAAGADAPLRLRFERLIANPPECPPPYAEDISRSGDNRPTRAFGCATVSNLAAMIANPADLISPRELDPADPQRRQAQLERYRTGQTTHSERSNDERVTISNAVR
jgi:pilus assembly protein CpaD